MYSWAAYLVTAAVVYAFLAARDNRRRDWTLFGLFSVAAAYTHHYALLAVVLVYGLTLVWVALRQGSRLRRALVTAGLAGLAYLPWLLPLVGQIQRGVTEFWASDISGQLVKNAVLFPFGYKWSVPYLPQSGQAAGLVALLGTGGCLCAIRRRSPSLGLLWLALGVYGLLLAIVVAVSYSVRPVLTPRYLSVVMGLLLLPAAYGLAALPWRALRLALCGVFFVLTVPILGHIQHEQFNGPWPNVTHTLSAQAGPDAVFVHTSLHTLGPLAYYFPDATHMLYIPSGSQTVRMPFYGPHVWFGPEPSAVTQAHTTIWLVGCGQPECGVADEWLASGQLGQVVERYDYREPYSWLSIVLARIQPGQP